MVQYAIIAQPLMIDTTVPPGEALVMHTSPAPMKSLKPYPPIFTIMISTIIIVIFIWGIVDSGEGFNWATTVSPPNREWWFFEVDAWENNCSDCRGDTHRLFSLQFAHAGFLHIFMNIVGLGIYGFLYEGLQGSIRTCIVFEMSVAMGTLGQNFYNPYGSLVGCSAGVYGLIGATLGNLCVNHRAMERVVTRTLWWGILFQFFLDGLLYIVWFNPGYGYAAHFMGFVTGFLASIVISFKLQPSVMSTLLSCVAFAFLVTLITSIGYSFANTWPPYPHYALPLHPGSTPSSCCQEMFALVYIAKKDRGGVFSDYICDGDHLVQING